MAHIGQVYLKKPSASILTGGGSAALDSDYQAILNYGLSQGFTVPSPENQATQNAFLVDMKANGIWGQLDIFYNLFTDGDANFAKINWIAPGTHQLVDSGVVAFVPISGFNFNPGSLNTGYRPGAGTKYGAAASFGFVCQDWSFAAGYMWGGYDGGIGRWAGLQRANQYFTINAGGLNVASGMLASHIDGGLVMVQMPDGYYQRFFVDGAQINEATVPSPKFDPYGVDWFIGGTNSVAITDVTVTGVQLYFAGGGLVGKEAAFYQSWSSYKNGTIASLAYKKIIDYAVLNAYAVPSDEQQVDQKKLIADLVGAGIWDSLDLFYNFLTDGDSNFAKINWKNPGTFQADGSGHDPVFTVNKGFKADGATQYLKTGLVLNTAPHFTPADAGYFISVEDLNVGAYDAGVDFAGFSQINAAGAAAQINSLATPLFAPGSPGLWLNSASPTTKLFLNGTLRSSGIAAAAVPGGSFYIFARNNNGATDAYSSRRVTMFGLGGSLAGKEAALYNAWNTYKNLYYVEPHPYDKILQQAASIGAAAPSASQQTIQRQLVDDLVSAGIWDELDIFYNFVTDGSSDFAKINWKAPGANQLVPSGGVAFVANSGFNLTAGYFNTGYRPTSSTKYYNEAGVGFVCNNWATISTNYMWGGYEGGVRWTTIQTGGNRFAINSGGFAAPPSIYQLRLDGGLVFMQASGFNVENLYVDGVLGATTGVPINTTPFTNDWVIGGTYPLAAAAVTISGLQLYFVGGSMLNKQAALYNAWIKYKATAISKAAYKAIIDYAILQGYALPSAPQQVVQEAFIYDLVVADVWDRLDIFYNVFSDGSADFCKINWKNPGTFNAATTASITYAPMVGFEQTNNGDAVGITSQFTPSVHVNASTKYQLNSAHFGFAFAGTQPTDNIAGTHGASPRIYVGMFGGGSWGVNDSSNGLTSQVWGGLHIGSRESASSLIVSKNGVVIANHASPSTGLPSIAPAGWLKQLDSQSSLGMIIESAFLGGALAGTEAGFYNAWVKYKSALQAKIAYKAIIDYAVLQAYPLPSGPQQTLQEKLIYDLMISEVWDKLDIFYCLKTDGSDNFSLINWKNPGTFQMVNIGGVCAFSTNNGWKNVMSALGTGLNSTFEPAINGVNTVAASCCIGVDYNVDDAVDLGSDIAGTYPPDTLITRFNGQFYLPNSVYGGNVIPSVLAGSGLAVIDRTVSTTDILYKNGVASVSDPVTAAPFGAGKKAVLLWNLAAGLPLGLKAFNFFMGGGLGAKQTDLYNAWNAYRSAIDNMSVDLTVMIGTDGADNGYKNGVFGAASPLLIGEERITGFYSKPDNTVHIDFEGAAQIEGVDRIMIQIPGFEAELLWTGIDYAGLSVPVVNALSAVSATVNFTLAT